MSTPALPQTPPSPGVGVRRKGLKSLPRLPLSAFSPPNSGTSEAFPLAPSPSTIHPEHVIDAHVAIKAGDAKLTQWSKEAGQVIGGKIGGVVALLSGSESEVEQVISQLDPSQSVPIITAIVPFHLDSPVAATNPSYLRNGNLPISLSTVFLKSTPEAVASLKWAFQQGRPVDIDFQAEATDATLEAFEDLLTKASTDLPEVVPIVLSNILPPPHDLSLTIVKLMKHPVYHAFQAQTAALSLIPGTYVKFLPPSWNAPTPATPIHGTSSEAEEKQKREWKRRIKMFLGPVIEAFGYQRIIFGSSPSPASQGPSNAGDWYELARESLAELGVEQDQIDAVFYENAKKVYRSKSP